jgi:hypothetical protein
MNSADECIGHFVTDVNDRLDRFSGNHANIMAYIKIFHYLRKLWEIRGDPAAGDKKLNVRRKVPQRLR